MIKIPDGLKVAVLMLVGIVASIFFDPILVFGAVIAASVGFMLIGKPYWLLMFLMFWSLTVFVWESIFHTPLLKRADDVMILLMVAVYAGNFALRRITPVPYMKLYLALIGVTVFSKVINGSPTSSLGLFLLAYGSPYLLFCLVHAVKDQRLSSKVVRLLIGIFIFSVVLNIGWMLGINPIFTIHMDSQADFAKGSIGSADDMAYFTIFILLMLVSLIRYSPKHNTRVWYGLLAAVALFQFYICYTTHAFGYLAIVLLVYMLVTRQKFGSYVAVGTVGFIAVAIMMFAGSYKADIEGKQGLAAVADPVLLETRWRSFLEEPKVDLYDKVVVHGYQEGKVQWLIGHGPGSGVGTVARTHPSDYTFKMLGDYYLTYSGRESMSGFSITQSPWSGTSSLVSEVGLTGTFLFFIMPLLPTKKVFQRLMRGYYDGDPAQKIIAEAFVTYVVLFFVINLMKDFWSVDSFVFTLWVLAALALREPKDKEEQVESVITPEAIAPAGRRNCKGSANNLPTAFEHPAL